MNLEPLWVSDRLIIPTEFLSVSFTRRTASQERKSESRRRVITSRPSALRRNAASRGLVGRSLSTASSTFTPAKTGTFCNSLARVVASTCSTFEICCICFIRLLGYPRCLPRYN